MNKYFLLLLLIAFAMSCSKDTNAFKATTNEKEFSQFEQLMTKLNQGKQFERIGEFEESFKGFNKSLVSLANGTVLEKVDSFYIFEGDIILKSETVDSILLKVPMTKSSVLNTPVKYWPRGIVPYKYSYISSFDITFKNKVEEALSVISSVSGVVFRPAQSTDINVIEFHHSGSDVGNNSPVGMQGGVQTVNICNSESTGVIMHEIMHSLGFYHEHSRADRDSYITINWSNIKPAKWAQFYIRGSGREIGSIDYGSVMMYANVITDTNFVYNTSESVMSIIGAPSSTTFGGQRDTLSAGDIRGLNNLYGAPYPKINIQSTVIEDTNGGTWETYITSKRVSIYLYSNKNYTSIQPTMIPKNIRLKKYVYTVDSNHQMQTDISYVDVTIPAGTGTFTIAEFEHRDHSELGVLYDYYDEVYDIVN